LKITQKVNNKWLLGILVAAVAVIAVMPMLGQEAEAGTNVPYFDESGTLQYAAATTDLTGGATILTAGDWYSLSASITLGAVTFVGTGEVCIIIPSGFTMLAPGTITVPSSVHLKLYTDTLDPAFRGAMSSSAAGGTTQQIFTLANGATLTNMVNVRYAGTGTAASAVYNAAGNSGTVYNYGELFGSTNTVTNGGFGVRFLGSGTIINYASGVIKSGGGIYRDTFGPTDVLTNHGEITAVTTNGVQIANGSGYLITNNGFINGAVGNHGIHLSSTASGATGKIINNGRIAGGPTLVTNAAIYVNNSATIVNNLGATLTGSNGIYIGNFNNGVGATKDYIENFGTVNGNGTGGSEATIRGRAIYVAAGADFVVTNHPGAEINGYLRGIQFANVALTGKIYNYGVIDGGTVTTIAAPSYGIQFGSSSTMASPGNGTGTFINYYGGTIRGTTGVCIANFNGAADTLTNNGLIEATGTAGTLTDVIGKGMLILNGTDTLITNEIRGEVRGIQSGIYFTTPGTATATCKIDNNGKITSINGPAVHVVKSGTVINTGDGTNNGLIKSTGSAGVHISISSGPGGLGDFITNWGRIEGTSGIFIQAGVSVHITNNITGKIIGTGYYGISVSGTMSGATKGVILNYGSIQGVTAGVDTTVINVINAAGDGINNGIITGGIGLNYKMSNSAGYYVINDGKIVGTTGHGVHFSNNTVPAAVTTVPAVVTNNITGTIIGATHGISLAPYAASPVNHGIARGVIDNHGTISGGSSGTSCGIYGGVSLSLTNRAGAEIIGAYGIQVNNFNGAADSVTNSGLISGTFRGVYFAGGTGILLTNNNEITGGTIGVRMDASGRVVNDGSIEGTADTGIHLAAGGGVTNNGTITGAIYGINASAGTNPVTLINADTINGSVVLNAGVNEIELTFGSRINGDLDISSSDSGSKLSFTDPTSSLGGSHIYTTVTGSTDIGTATVDVDFSTIPSPFDGWDIVLIDGTGGIVTGTSANSTYPLGGHTFYIRAKQGHQLVASLSEDDILITMRSFPAGAALHCIRESPMGFFTSQIPYTGPFYAGSSEHLELTTGSIAGFNFVEWVDDIGNVISAISATTPPVSLLPYLGTLTVTFTAEFSAIPIDPYQYYITAVADSGSTITPVGVVVLNRGDTQTFVFVAKTGYVIVEVWIDGLRNLTPAEIDLGEFTFYDIMANHTISVKSIAGSKTDPILRIDIKEGEGHAEYRVDNGDFIRYRTEVILPMGSDLTVRAVPAVGYIFDRWESPDVIKTNETNFDNVRGPLYLELYFSIDDTGKDNGLIWWILLFILLLLIAGFLVWFFLYYRKTYDVIKIESAIAIIGKDKVRRKSEYTFKVEGSPSGTISYRVGEAGQWKAPFVNPSGEYVIPKGEITDTVTIEDRW